MKEKSGPAKGKVKIRGAKELAEDLNESSVVKRPKTPNPIKNLSIHCHFPRIFDLN